MGGAWAQVGQGHSVTAAGWNFVGRHNGQWASHEAEGTTTKKGQEAVRSGGEKLSQEVLCVDGRACTDSNLGRLRGDM